MEEPLTSVSLVCSAQQRVAALPHVKHKIDAFVWVDTARWSLSEASDSGFIHLMDRLLKREPPDIEQRLRQRQYRFGRYMPNHDASVLEWVFNMAADHARFPVLDWIYQETQGKLPNLQQSLCCSDPDVVIWLFEHGSLRCCNQSIVTETYRWKPNTSFQSFTQCLTYEHSSFQNGNHDRTASQLIASEAPQPLLWVFEHRRKLLSNERSPFQIQNTGIVVSRLIEYEELESLEWLHEHRPELFKPHHLDHAIQFGRLDVAKWMRETFPKGFFGDPQRLLKPNFKRFKCDIATIEWVVSEIKWTDENACLEWLDGVLEFAANSGKLVMMELAFKLRSSLIKCASHGIHEPTLRPTMMDEAAANGYLPIVQWLNGHQGQEITVNTMDRAAENGHLEIVQWLHQNRSEGCTNDAMNKAAGKGHLDVVRWLHDNRFEGCTTKAMDNAAASGHLQVVQWLHENRTEGCTRHAMNEAARSGHVQVVKWLHEARTEGIPATALACALGNHQVDVMRYFVKAYSKSINVTGPIPMEEYIQLIS